MQSPTRLRELLEMSSHGIDVYRSPDLTELREALTPVTRELDCEIGQYDRIVSIDELHAGFGVGRRGYFEIITEYHVRQCKQESSICIPIDVVDAEDPVAAAREYQAAVKLGDARTEVSIAYAGLLRSTEKLIQALGDTAGAKQVEEFKRLLEAAHRTHLQPTGLV
ncbi:hypothetical protein FDI24_gp031 [Acidovorax phage ACP17]|uniref:Uncharacterized protein n=1 Tax=Acidovorax phage ACP17 TaxID=2010329 RepID=A0A218M3E7_9CAUD|nr:hypothetical protein FDI24_gp031 [Acidovorax phage ACP17]ASD50565.1 hypothetical protein [Acidovorax phage ACP17]